MFLTTEWLSLSGEGRRLKHHVGEATETLTTLRELREKVMQQESALVKMTESNPCKETRDVCVQASVDSASQLYDDETQNHDAITSLVMYHGDPSVHTERKHTSVSCCAQTDADAYRHVVEHGCVCVDVAHEGVQTDDVAGGTSTQSQQLCVCLDVAHESAQTEIQGIDNNSWFYVSQSQQNEASSTQVDYTNRFASEHMCVCVDVVHESAQTDMQDINIAIHNQTPGAIPTQTQTPDAEEALQKCQNTEDDMSGARGICVLGVGAETQDKACGTKDDDRDDDCAGSQSREHSGAHDESEMNDFDSGSVSKQQGRKRPRKIFAAHSLANVCTSELLSVRTNNVNSSASPATNKRMNMRRNTVCPSELRHFATSQTVPDCASIEAPHAHDRQLPCGLHNRESMMQKTRRKQSNQSLCGARAETLCTLTEKISGQCYSAHNSAQSSAVHGFPVSTCPLSNDVLEPNSFETFCSRDCATSLHKDASNTPSASPRCVIRTRIYTDPTVELCQPSPVKRDAIVTSSDPPHHKCDNNDDVLISDACSSPACQGSCMVSEPAKRGIHLSPKSPKTRTSPSHTATHSDSEHNGDADPHNITCTSPVTGPVHRHSLTTPCHESCVRVTAEEMYKFRAEINMDGQKKENRCDLDVDVSCIDAAYRSTHWMHQVQVCKHACAHREIVCARGACAHCCVEAVQDTCTECHKHMSPCYQSSSHSACSSCSEHAVRVLCNACRRYDTPPHGLPTFCGMVDMKVPCSSICQPIVTTGACNGNGSMISNSCNGDTISNGSNISNGGMIISGNGSSVVRRTAAHFLKSCLDMLLR
jgi:hypothetical protein